VYHICEWRTRREVTKGTESESWKAQGPEWEGERGESSPAVVKVDVVILIAKDQVKKLGLA
jgi:hypothetical protein